MATTRDLFSLHFFLFASCSSFLFCISFARVDFFVAATSATNCCVQSNFFASRPRVHFTGSSERRRRISTICSVDSRGGGVLSAEGRIRGGKAEEIGEEGDLRRGDTGLVVNDIGEGAVGGGR